MFTIYGLTKTRTAFFINFFFFVNLVAHVNVKTQVDNYIKYKPSVWENICIMKSLKLIFPYFQNNKDNCLYTIYSAKYTK